MNVFLGRHLGSLFLESNHEGDSTGRHRCSHGRVTQLLRQPQKPKQAVSLFRTKIPGGTSVSNTKARTTTAGLGLLRSRRFVERR